MAKFNVEFTLSVSTSRVIKAETEEEAERIAMDMLYDKDGDEYWEGIINDMEDEWENWRKKYCEIDAFDELDDSVKADNE